MPRSYLLGFVQNCLQAPAVGGLRTNLTCQGEKGILWCQSPLQIFPTKQDYLLAVLNLWQFLCQSQISVIPIQSGIYVNQEANIVKILQAYEEELQQCFTKISGCWEYYLNIKLPWPPSPHLAQEELSSGRARNGMEYINLIRRREQYKAFKEAQVTAAISHYRSRLMKWAKDFWSETVYDSALRIDLGFLVSYKNSLRFCRELEILIKETDLPTRWTGPWLPFHFSTFSLKRDHVLFHEPLNWEQRRDANDYR